MPVICKGMNWPVENKKRRKWQPIPKLQTELANIFPCLLQSKLALPSQWAQILGLAIKIEDPDL